MEAVIWNQLFLLNRFKIFLSSIEEKYFSILNNFLTEVISIFRKLKAISNWSEFGKLWLHSRLSWASALIQQTILARSCITHVLKDLVLVKGQHELQMNWYVLQM